MLGIPEVDLDEFDFSAPFALPQRTPLSKPEPVVRRPLLKMSSTCSFSSGTQASTHCSTSLAPIKDQNKKYKEFYFRYNDFFSCLLKRLTMLPKFFESYAQAQKYRNLRAQVTQLLSEQLDKHVTALNKR